MTGLDTVAHARVLVDAQRYQDAVAALAPHLAGQPGDEVGLCLLAQAQLGLANRHRALDAANAALRLSPDNEWALRLISVALTGLRRFDEARYAADEAVRAAPAEWRCHQQRARVDVAAKSVTPASWQAAQRAVELAPHEASTYQVLGGVALAAKKSRAAERAFRQALAIDPQDAVSQNNLGVALLRRRRLGKATAAITGAARLDPSSTRYAGNFRVVVRARIAYLALASVLIELVCRAGLEPVSTVRGRPGLLTVCVGLDVLAAALLFWRLRRALGRSFAPFAATTMRRDFWLSALTVLATSSVALFAVAGILGYPTGSSWLGIAIACGVAAVLALRVDQVRNRRRARSRR
jgi:Flp pilus assembly protein TadD